MDPYSLSLMAPFRMTTSSPSTTTAAMQSPVWRLSERSTLGFDDGGVCGTLSDSFNDAGPGGSTFCWWLREGRLYRLRRQWHRKFGGASITVGPLGSRPKAQSTCISRPTLFGTRHPLDVWFRTASESNSDAAVLQASLSRPAVLARW